MTLALQLSWQKCKGGAATGGIDCGVWVVRHQPTGLTQDLACRRLHFGPGDVGMHIRVLGDCNKRADMPWSCSSASRSSSSRSLPEASWRSSTTSSCLQPTPARINRFVTRQDSAERHTRRAANERIWPDRWAEREPNRAGN